MMDTRPFGIDVSRYDGLINYDAVLARTPTVEFLAFRSTISYGYADPFFYPNWAGARIRCPGVPRAAYHVLYPGEDITRQVDNIDRAVGEDFDVDHDRVVIDAELDHGQTRATITGAIDRMANEIKKRFWHLPLLYSRPYWLNEHTHGVTLNYLETWLAQYLTKMIWQRYAREHPGPVMLPAGFTRPALIHQTGDKCQPFCATTTKQYQDYNRARDRAALRAFFGYAAPAPQPAPAVRYVLTYSPYRNLRGGPGTGYGVVGRLETGALFEVAERTGDWGRLPDGKWIYMANGIKQL